MAQDHVSTSGEFFGINPGNESTNAPGGGNIAQTQPGPGSTGAPSNAGTSQAQPQDLESVGGTHTANGRPVHHSFTENTYHEVDQSGMAHGGVEAANGSHPLAGEFTNQTGAGSGSAGHHHNGS